MKNILVLGAGRSAVTLIKYLLDHSNPFDWRITVADFSHNLAKKIVGNHPNAKAIFFNVNDQIQREKEIASSNIVISMLPASMHILVAKDCLKFKKNLVTASYVSDEIAALDIAAKDAGVLFLNEIGLDPGIDHMSAMHVIDSIKEKDGKLISFKSFCGGLVHPDYDTNPWNYKFTWNPRNVVLAGQGTAQYIENSKYKYIPYNQLFERIKNLEVLDAGNFEAYANRDSLSYRIDYGLDDIPTMYRGTLRRRGYSESWNVFVQLGMTDDSYKIENSDILTKREFIDLFLPYDDSMLVEDKFCKQFNITFNSDIFKKISWLGFFTDDKIGLKQATPAKLLQAILEEKWILDSQDKDMIVMQHQFEYMQDGNLNKLNSSLVVFGDTPTYTAMAKTVGLPVAIATKLILSGKIDSVGVKIPTDKQVYLPVLKELKENGINFVEELV
tara:strand:- start:270 stop:1598 length:1329 start_codon:yes stop_codon:yes gene_type:complete